MNRLTSEIQVEVREEFERSGRLLTFDGFLAEIEKAPYLRLRSAVQYCADMLDHFGHDEVLTIGRKSVRYRVFDAPFGGDPVFGQEQVQDAVVRAIHGFAEDGRSDKLIVLTGPNGSSKSSLIDLIFRGLEAYSRDPEGALYRFNWVFPNRALVTESIGFGGGPDQAAPTSFALLKQKEIQAKLSCELKDHPILLLPREARARLLTRLEASAPMRRNVRQILDDDLCAKCRAIYDALLDDYSGDWLAVLQHVQVQRFSISRRYRRGAVTIEPQGNMDATVRQVTADQSLANLPPSLQSLSLVQPGGDLVDASAGAIEYSDLLKRSVEANKYLLTTCEKGTISLPGFMAYLNLVMFATTNEKQLDAFKQDRIFTSFKGRMDFVSTPYLLEVSKEEKIYDRTLARISRQCHVAPGSSRAAALWAVLTRLHCPNPEHYDPPQRALIASLSPIEKLWLYDCQEAPRRMGNEDRRKLMALLPDLRTEYEGTPIYEGRHGISPREVNALLADAVTRGEFACVCPQSILRELEELIRDASLYDFLQIEPRSGYHDAKAFIEEVYHDALTRIDRDFSDAVGLVSDAEYERRFDQYFLQVKASVRGEKVPNQATGEMDEPDETLMEGMEKLFGLAPDDDRQAFRRDFLTRIGAWVHETGRVDIVDSYRDVFQDLFSAMRRRIRSQHAVTIRRIREALLRLGTGSADSIPPRVRRDAERALAFLKTERGYCDACAKAAVVFLEKHENSQQDG
jgi:predicted Ser/Thr protein kinase